ncbi:MAG: SEC-C domain-containing protein, partial [Planctomycetales bacterium]|nr:SEC-C domain-containing protein [Planctomycetales bacterium]
MAIDLYAPCLCGSGKKLKFCCKDLAPEIEKIQQLVSADQPRAALQRVEQLLEKQPRRVSLLELRAMLQFHMHLHDEVGETIDRLLEAAPESPVTYGYAAILAANRGETREAIELLQDALERVENTIGRSVLEAIGYVGHAVLLAGDVVAGRGHISLYAGMAQDERNQGVDALLRLNHEGDLPLLLREQPQLRSLPEDHPKAAELEEILQRHENGRWRSGRAAIEAMIDPQAPEPALVYDAAMFAGWLGDQDAYVSGMHQYAEMNVSLHEAVAAEAMAQLIASSHDEPQMETLRIRFELTDVDVAADRLRRNEHIEAYIGPISANDQEVRPRDAYLLLDRAIPPSGDLSSFTEVPVVLAYLSMFGKRTDCPAHIDVTVDDNSDLPTGLELLLSVLGDVIGPEMERKVLGAKPLAEAALSWRWQLPPDTPEDVRHKLLTAKRRQCLLEGWTHTPLSSLDGLAPVEAAGQQKYRIPLLACVLILEQGAVTADDLESFQELRQHLQLPRLETFVPNEVEFARLPIALAYHFDMQALSDEQLTILINRSSLCAEPLAGLMAASELVTRDADPKLKFLAYRVLVRRQHRIADALAASREAADWAESIGQDPAEWLVERLALSLEFEDGDTAQATLDELAEKHFDKPAIREATFRILHDSGVLGELAEQEQSGEFHAPHAAATPASKLWTPGSDPPPASG